MQRIIAAQIVRNRLPIACSPIRTLTAYAWGNADHGQLGLPSEQLTDEPHTFGQKSPLPQRIPGLGADAPTCVSISCSHSAFVRPDGTLLTCGHGQQGQLGLGDREDRAHPSIVHSLPPVTAVACGASHTLALSRDGLVFAFGSNVHAQLGLVVEGDNRVCATTPQLVTRLAEDGHRIVALAAGDHFSAAVSDNGRVLTWGAPGLPALGHARAPSLPALLRWVERRAGAARTEAMPRLVRSLAHVHVADVVAGRHHVVVLDTDGRAYAWGGGRHYLLGNESECDSFTPRRAFTSVRAIRKVAIGNSHALILTRDGAVFAVGENDHGCLGTGAQSSLAVAAVAEQVLDAAPASDVAAGWHVSAVVGRNGTVRTWGCCAAGALGVEGGRDIWAPRCIGLKARRVVMSCGGTSVIATV